MVLVDKDYRGIGISKSLLSLTLEKLKSFRSIKLDATPAGQPVYQKFGFKEEYHISRMVNLNVQPVKVGEADSETEPIHPGDISEIIALDEEAFGVNRNQLIEHLIKENPADGTLLTRNGQVVAFALSRKGSRYVHIGPVVADSTAVAKNLIAQLLITLVNQPVVVDVLGDKSELFQWLHLIGFKHQRDFMRMYKGENDFPGKPDKLFLICGPECG
jgi:predicted N-acetyltransferase YhbS